MISIDRLKEITECGFYCSKNDVERIYIYEVIKNTDEKWLKENPEATLLIDGWIYDHTDYDDRKVYCTGGNLNAICNDFANCKVYKIEDTKYKKYGNCGQFLIEDKPIYNEQLDQLKASYEELKKQACGLRPELKYIIDKTCCKYNINAKYYHEKIVEIINNLDKYNQTLTEIKEIAKPFCEECKEFDDLHKDRDCMYCNYNKILQEIRKVMPDEN